MKTARPFAAVLAALTLFAAGCATTPKSENAREELNDSADVALKRFIRQDPTLQAFLDHSAGYAVLPSIGKGGLGIGGSFGRGQVYEAGSMVGYCKLTQASIGFQAGGQAYAELIVFETPAALNKFKASNYAFTADASAVAVTAGAAAHANFKNGVAVFTHVNGGLMYEAAIGGQKFSYESK